MAADFGIDVELIPEEGLQAQIDKLVSCLKDSGIEIDIDINEPGLGSLIATLIRSIEKAIIAAYEPIIALVKVVIEAIDAGINAATVFLDKISNVINAIGELLSGLPLSIIEFIVNKIVEPITKNINIPFPSIEGILDIILGKESLISIDWEKWLEEGKLIIPESLKAKGEEKVKQVLTLFQSFNGLLPPFLKILEVLLFPIKFAIGAIEGIISKVQDLVTNLFDAIGEIVDLIGDPVGFVLDFIADIFSNVLAPIIQNLIPIDEKDVEAFIVKFKELISLIFKIGAVKIDIDGWIEALPPTLKTIFKQVVSFIKIIQCFIFWIVGLLNPQTILGMFGLGNFKLPPIEFTNWSANTKAFSTTKISSEDLAKMFKANDKIIIKQGPGFSKEATIISVFRTSIVVKELVYSSDINNDSFEISKK